MSTGQYTIDDIASAIGGTTIAGNGQTIIKTLLIDSRKLSGTEHVIFFAIKGERHDGHIYIEELLNSGVTSFIVSQKPENSALLEKGNFILVEDTLAALQLLSAKHRAKFQAPVIGITGSNGKTITKEWLYQLLREDKNIVRSPKSFNSQVGVPLSVWQMNSNHELAIFEAGISKPDEMFNLEKVIKPTIGLFTNLGLPHDENFDNHQQKAKEKLKLFVHTEYLLYCRDYLVLDEAIRQSNNLKNTKFITWSKKTRADLQIGRITKGAHETEIQGVCKNTFIRIVIPFTDEASIENAINCWLVMLHLGYENEKIAERIKFLSPVAMRLELKEGINHCSVINDSYNSDLGSLQIALDFLEQQKQHPKKTIILSDILQSGKDVESLYTEVAELLQKKKVDRLIGIGEAISSQAEKFRIDKSFYNSTQDFLEKYDHSIFNNEVILLKGARMFGFEDINKVLQQKTHETVLEIDLNALVNNLNYYKSQLLPTTKVMGMVKAFSYGSGSHEIANVLQFQRIDYLAVAYADEGIELRKSGITVPIMVMNPEVQSYDSMIHYNLEPEIFNMRVFELFAEAVKRNTASLEKPFPIHIKLDTGMHRLGFQKNELNELMIRIKNNQNLSIRSVFSHLAASDAPEFDSFSRQQIQLFRQMSEQITSFFNYKILRHILNSAGISRFPDAQFDMVRLGIGLYGIGVNESEQHKLMNVSTLKSSISQINQIPAGESIGYNRAEIAQKDLTIATIPIGYADGLSRKHGNRKGKLIVAGQEAPIVGNVCMDMCMIDITNIHCKEGDEVIVFGNEYPIDEFAKVMETIPYEVLTSVSRRVKRVYYQE